MSRNRLFIIISGLLSLACIVTLVGCKLEPEPEQKAATAQTALSENQQQKNLQQTPEFKAGATMIANNLNSFGEGLFNSLDSTENDNQVVSPLSVYTALSMVYAGAAGKTALQFEQTLQNDQKQKIHPLLSRLQIALMAMNKGDDNQLLIANALWLQKDFAVKSEFLKIARESYGSGAKQVDFGTPEVVRTSINNWTADNTRQKIKVLIRPSQLTPLTRLVLTNAVFFKGDWQFPFDVVDTKELPFNISKGNVATVPTMYRKGNYNIASNQDSQILELPYQSGFSMMLILPQKNGNSAPKLSQLVHQFDNLEKNLVRVYLPKFKIQSNVSLKTTLKKMGIQDAFDDGLADFSGITDNGANSLAISDVIHNAFVEVNEKGTEAAAATAVIMATKSMMPPEIIDFKVERPFIFAIRENSSGAVLFWGRVVDPRK